MGIKDKQTDKVKVYHEGKNMSDISDKQANRQRDIDRQKLEWTYQK